MRNSKKIRLWVFGTVITLILISIPTTGIVLYNRSLQTNDKTNSLDVKNGSTAKPNTISDSNKEAPSKPVPAHTDSTNTAPPTQPTNNAQDTPKQPIATSTTPQQPTTYQQPSAPAVSCNETMKSSYTSLYNAYVNAENASWYRQIEAWNSEANSRGMAFNGYTQGMIDQYKPAHDARLAGLQTEYYQNLVSVNCNP